MRNKISSMNIVYFRKLENINFEVADKLTVISGHNGVGKSTILGLIANGSEFTKHKNLLGKDFRSKFEEIFHLDIAKDYTARLDKKYKVILEYEYKGVKIYKSCTISKHLESRKDSSGKTTKNYRLKIVPRTSNADGKTSQNKIEGIGPAAKVQIPTIYLGLSRLIPIGESDSKLYKLIQTTKIETIDEDFIKNSYKEILNSRESFEEDSMVRQELKYSVKSSVGPIFSDYPFKAISTGQDSLTTLLTAVASFKNLKRKLNEEYEGGILLIDEIDCGLHPVAQRKLIAFLNKQSKVLNLQIIATTHSLTILKDVLNLKALSENANSNLTRPLHNVIYLSGSNKPILRKNLSYQSLKSDLLNTSQITLEKKPIINIYLEDKEAVILFNSIIKYAHSLLNQEIEYNVIPSQISCDTLLKLPEKDQYFKSVIICPDGDVKNKGIYIPLIEEHKNIVPLIGEDSPEAVYHLFGQKLLNNLDHEFWQANNDLLNENRLNEIVDEINIALSTLKLDDSGEIKDKSKKRDKYKVWFNKYGYEFHKTNLELYLLMDYEEEIKQFISELNYQSSELLRLEALNSL